MIQIFNQFLFITDKSVKELREDNIFKVRLEIGNVKTAVVNLTCQVTKYHEEMLVSGHRTNRFVDWAVQVGQKISVPIVF